MESEINSDVFARPLPPPATATATTTLTSSTTSASSALTSNGCASSSSTVASSCPSSRLVGRLQLLNETGQIKQDVPLSTKVNHEQASFVVGRTKGVALCIPHVQVSRKHAQIDYDARQQNWSLLDTGSSNGVFVNGRKLEKDERIAIDQESVIKLGPTEDFRLRLVDQSRWDSHSTESPAKRRKTVTFGIESELQVVAGVREANSGPSVQVEVRNGVATAANENGSSMTKTTSNESIDDDTATAKININEGQANKENNGAFDFLRPDVSMDRRRSNQFMATSTKLSAVSASTISTVTTLTAAASCPLLGHGGVEDPSDEADNAAAMAIILNTRFGHEEDFDQGEIGKVDASDGEHKLTQGEKADEGTDRVVDSSSESLASKMKSKISSELSCTICNEIFIKPMSLPCGHVFCSFCLSQWKKKSSNTQFVCPNCRYKVGREKINHNIYIANLIESLVEEIGGDLQRSFQEAVASREEEEEKERQAEEEKKKASKPRSSRGRQRGSTSRASTSTTGTTVSTTTASSRSRATSTFSGRSVGHTTSHAGTIRNYMVGGTVNSAASTSTAGNRGRGSSRGRTSRNGAVAIPTTRPVDVITLSDDNNNEEEDDNEDDGEDEEDDSDSEEDSDSDYAEGDPDATYGGYGRCFNCGRRGHWYGGCPFV